MARFWKWSPLGVLFATIVTIAPHQVLALTGNFVDPIIPQSGSCLCTSVYGAYDWGCILQVLQNVINAAVTLGVILCVIWIAYAGFTLMLSGGSSSAREQGKTRVANAVIGIIVILCAWLVVDFIMKVIYEPTTAFNGTTFGPWNDILAPSGDDYCIKQTTPQAITTGTVGILTGVAPGTGTPPTGTTPSTGSASGDCSPTAIAADWGSEQKGNLFSCIINNESKCQNISTQIKNSNSSAGGRYQVLMSSGPSGQGLNFPACVSIAKSNGYTGTTLNCAAYYPKGYSDGSTNANACKAAQLDPTCNTQVAQYLYSHGGVGAWLGRGDIGGKNQACVTQYGS